MDFPNLNESEQQQTWDWTDIHKTNTCWKIITEYVGYTYHVNGDLSNLGWAISFSEILYSFLLLRNLLGEDSLQVSRVWEVTQNNRQGW
jgi:hypothetical protein